MGKSKRYNLMKMAFRKMLNTYHADRQREPESVSFDRLVRKSKELLRKFHAGEDLCQ